MFEYKPDLSKVEESIEKLTNETFVNTTDHVLRFVLNVWINDFIRLLNKLDNKE